MEQHEIENASIKNNVSKLKKKQNSKKSTYVASDKVISNNKPFYHNMH